MRRAAVAVAVGLLVAGCGGLPTPAGVKVVRSIGAAVDDSGEDVRVLPPGPSTDADPAHIVSGFLNAEANSDDTAFDVAREYLAPATTWTTTGTTEVYRDPTTAVHLGPDGTTATVTTTATVLATIDGQGTYAAQDTTVSESYALGLARGAWRITSLPAGLRLTASGLGRTFAASTLWWLSPDQRQLVPEQRWLPQQTTGRATQLVRSLLAGPSAGYGTAVRTAVPAGTTLEGSVAVEGSDLAVDLSRAAVALTPAQAQLLLLQLAATLSDVTSVSGVRLLVDGQPLPAAGDPRRIAISAASPYLPPTTSAAPVLVVDGGHVRALPDGPMLPAPLEAALAGRVVSRAVPSPDGEMVAVVTGGAVVVVLADGTARTVAAAPDAALSWTQDGRLAVGLPDRLLLVAGGGAVTSMAYGPGVPTPVADLRIARDGVRVVVTGGRPGARQAVVALISGTTVAAPVPLQPGGPDVAQVAWQDATDVALAVDPDGQPVQLASVSTDGSSPDEVPLPTAVGRTVSLAGGPGSPVLVAGGGSVEELTNDSGWRRVASGDRPGIA